MNGPGTIFHLLPRIRWAARVAGGGALAAALLAAGCVGSVVYRPTARSGGALLPSQARAKVQALIGQALSDSGQAFEMLTGTKEGFSFADPGAREAIQPKLHSYRFAQLSSLAVITASNGRFAVELGEAALYWGSQADAVAFVNAVQAIRYPTPSGLLEDDAATTLVEFRAKAAAWRALNPRPELPEEARRYKVLAEDAFRNKKLTEAIGYYEQGLAVCPLWPEGHFNAALLCGEADKSVTAVLHMRRYLELCPDSADARAARDKMYVWEEKVKKIVAAPAPNPTSPATRRARDIEEKRRRMANPDANPEANPDETPPAEEQPPAGSTFKKRVVR